MHFTKVVASGNDFILIDKRHKNLARSKHDYSKMARLLCPRHFSVGADGLLVLEDSSNASFRMRIINPDGREAGSCGNGARASAYFAARNGLENKLSIETKSGILQARVRGNNVRLGMNDPKDIKLGIRLKIGSNEKKVNYINTGVPHVVHVVTNLKDYPVVETGRIVRNHPLFKPEGTNVDFVGNIKGNNITVRTYERGVEDETLACGTGAIAAALILVLLGYVKSPIKVKTRSGEVLAVHCKKIGKKITDVCLEGKADIVYEGKI